MHLVSSQAKKRTSRGGLSKIIPARGELLTHPQGGPFEDVAVGAREYREALRDSHRLTPADRAKGVRLPQDKWTDKQTHNLHILVHHFAELWLAHGFRGRHGGSTALAPAQYARMVGIDPKTAKARYEEMVRLNAAYQSMLHAWLARTYLVGAYKGVYGGVRRAPKKDARVAWVFGVVDGACTLDSFCPESERAFIRIYQAAFKLDYDEHWGSK